MEIFGKCVCKMQLAFVFAPCQTKSLSYMHELIYQEKLPCFCFTFQVLRTRTTLPRHVSRNLTKKGL